MENLRETSVSQGFSWFLNEIILLVSPLGSQSTQHIFIINTTYLHVIHVLSQMPY